MPEHHHGDPGMHNINNMWHYFGAHYWWNWLILIGVVAIIFFLLQKNKNR